ncbi:MAG: hypothetical protein HY372_02455 [Candidatus Andersenbacteria bacterium]|nr:hypothetical protein [Candidatus Andersenbacteria bacterium]
MSNLQLSEAAECPDVWVAGRLDVLSLGHGERPTSYEGQRAVKKQRQG